MASDLAVHMEAVALRLLGKPNEGLSSETELRYGTRGSLAVDLATGVWRDHEKGTGGGVLGLIRRETGRANGAAFEWLRDELGLALDEERKKHARPARRIVATYDYHGSCGAVLFQVVRFAPKGFSQRRPDGKGGWVYKLGDAPRVLYRLPDLIAAGPDELVFVVEGEKDADRLRELGFVATTSPGGAGNWEMVDDAALRGRQVVIVPDLDEPGLAYERQVAAALAGKAALARVLHLPIPNPSKTCKDVSDWLDNCGGTADKLRRLADVAREANPETPDPEVLNAKEPVLAELEERYFVVRHGGKVLIAQDDEDPVLRRKVLHFLDSAGLRLLYANRFVQSEVGKVPAVKAWLISPERRTFNRIALLPNRQAPPDTYNLWRGWGVEPKAGRWPLIEAHLREVICSGNERHFRWLVKWLAYCVQHPDRQAEVALVLRGLKGAGKGMLGRMLLGIFRHHALQITQQRHLVGNFNAHLLDTCFLFVDEAFWAGDKQGLGALNGLITEDTLTIEPKGLTPFQAPNRLKIVIAANADWVVPATADERRYFAPTVSDQRRGDRAYFNKLYAAIDGDELPAFLAHLLAHDLTGFDVRDPPHTKELARQKLIGANSVGRFRHDCLNEGAVVGTAEAGWPGSVVTQVLHAAYVDHAAAHGDRHPKTDVQMVDELKKLWAGCGVKVTRPRGQPYTPPNGQAIERPNRYALDTLENHRRAFLAAMNIDPADHAWPEVESEP